MDRGLTRTRQADRVVNQKQIVRTLPLVAGTLVPLDLRRTWLSAVIFLTKLSVREIREL
jgi:hypothetical protein